MGTDGLKVGRKDGCWNAAVIGPGLTGRKSKVDPAAFGMKTDVGSTFKGPIDEISRNSLSLADIIMEGTGSIDEIGRKAP